MKRKLENVTCRKNLVVMALDDKTKWYTTSNKLSNWYFKVIKVNKIIELRECNPIHPDNHTAL